MGGGWIWASGGGLNVKRTEWKKSDLAQGSCNSQLALDIGCQVSDPLDCILLTAKAQIAIEWK